jgi:cellulose synthase/poly-beta-1,6-N-acetylglucosamine synthase-like glycosyltransferase
MATIAFFAGMFILAVFLIIYTYIIFPGLLAILAGEKKLVTNHTNTELPGVSIIISAYNEETVIQEKLESILNSDFPKSKYEILIGSDSSNDDTCGIVRSLLPENSNIKLSEFKERRGKPSVINDLIDTSVYPIIILTDANVIFEKSTIKNLVRHFKDERMGLVGANILNKGMKRDGISIQEKSYIERENLIKYREGILWGTMMGPFGGCFALRKILFEKVPEGFLVDDFYISMNILKKDYKCVNDLEAICFEDVSNDILQEYKRKSRISAGNFQNLKYFKKYLFRPFSPIGFCFISHKVLRWMTPFFIIISLVSLIVLSFYDRIYLLLLIGEILLLFTPLIDWMVRKIGFHFKFLRFVSYFSFMNLALLRGFFKFIGGIDSGVWTPTKRN